MSKIEEVEIVYYDLQLDQLMCVTSDIGSISLIVLGIFNSVNTEFIGLLEGK